MVCNRVISVGGSVLIVSSAQLWPSVLSSVPSKQSPGKKQNPPGLPNRMPGQERTCCGLLCLLKHSFRAQNCGLLTYLLLRWLEKFQFIHWYHGSKFPTFGYLYYYNMYL